MRFLLSRKGEGKTRICRFVIFWVDIRSHKKGFNYRRRFAAIVSLACNESLRLQGLILRCKLVRTATVLRHKRQPCIIIRRRIIPLHKPKQQPIHIECNRWQQVSDDIFLSFIIELQDRWTQKSPSCQLGHFRSTHARAWENIDWMQNQLEYVIKNA